MNKDKVIEQMEEALKEADELYNAVMNGEISYKEAGERFDSIVGWKTVQALSKGLIHLKGEE